jgi:hypothetical protein
VPVFYVWIDCSRTSTVARLRHHKNSFAVLQRGVVNAVGDKEVVSYDIFDKPKHIMQLTAGDLVSKIDWVGLNKLHLNWTCTT